MGDNNNKLGFVGEKIQYTSLKNINMYKSESINPAKYPNEIFEVYSVPAFETGHPEYLHGEEIASNKNIVQKDDILLCKINPRINRVWVVADESEHQNIASSEWIVIRTKEYNPEFLAWYLRTPKFQQLMTSEVTGIGGSLTRAQPKRVAEYPVPVVDREMQERITNVLNHVSHMVQLKKQELRQLDTLIKARFVELFGNPLDGTAKYTIHHVGDVAEAVDPQPSHRTPPVQEGGIPYVSIKDCDYKTGKFDFEGARKVNKKVLEEHLNRYTLHDGDFIIGKIGTIGKPIFVPIRTDYTLSANVVLVQPNSELVSPYFLKYSFESDFVERQFFEAKNSTSQAAFGIQKVRAIEVMNPNLDVQREFEEFAKQIDKSKVAVQKSLDELQILFDSLMQEYFG